MAQRKTTSERFEDHSKRLDRLETSFASMVGDVKGMKAVISGDGNGNIGMGERLRNLNDDINEIKNIEQDRKTSREKWSYGVMMLFIAQAISTMVTLGVSAFLWFARIAPVLEKMQP